MSDREALAAAFKRIDGKVESKADWLIVHAAACERLAQLPEKCEHGKTEGHWRYEGLDPDKYGSDQRWCSGKVYPAELVERIVKVIKNDLSQTYEAEAVAVLDALNGETE